MTMQNKFVLVSLIIRSITWFRIYRLSMCVYKVSDHLSDTIQNTEETRNTTVLSRPSLCSTTQHAPTAGPRKQKA